MPAVPESIPLHSLPQKFLAPSVEDRPKRTEEEERVYEGWGRDGVRRHLGMFGSGAVDAQREIILRPLVVRLAQASHTVVLQRALWKSPEVVNLHEKNLLLMIALCISSRTGKGSVALAKRRKMHCFHLPICVWYVLPIYQTSFWHFRVSQIVFLFSSLCDRCVIRRAQPRNHHMLFSLEGSINERK